MPSAATGLAPAPATPTPRAEPTVQPTMGPEVEPKIVRVGAIPAMLKRGAWLLLETTVIPTVLLYTAMRLWGPMVGIGLVMTWRLGLVTARIVRGRRVPASVALSTGMFGLRTGLSLAFTSVWV